MLVLKVITRKIALLLIFTGLSFCALAQGLAQNNSDQINLLVITGGPTLKHKIDLVPTSFYSLFMGYDNLTWDHATHDEAAFQTDRLSEYDVILMYNRSDSLSEKSKQNLKKYLASKKGLIVLHHALGSYNNWEWWWKEVVGGKYQMKATGDFSKSDYKQGETIRMIPQKDHPLTVLGSFELSDETYKDLWISEKSKFCMRRTTQTAMGQLHGSVHSKNPKSW